MGRRVLRTHLSHLVATKDPFSKLRVFLVDSSLSNVRHLAERRRLY